MGASYEETLALAKKRAAEKAEKAKASPGLLNSFVRGVQTSPMINMPVAGPPQPQAPHGAPTEPADMLDELVMRSYTEPMERPEWGQPGMSDEDYARQNVEHGYRSPIQTKIKPPQEPGERIAHAVGQDAPAIAAGAVLGPLMGAATGIGTGMALLGELGLGAVGSTVGRTIEEQGGSAPLQIGGEIVATAAAPLTVPAKVGRRLGIRAAAAGMSEEAIKSSLKAAEKHGVDPSVWMQTVSELKRKFARGKKEPEKFIKKAVQNLDTDIKAFGENTPTLAQSAGEYGGTNIASWELGLAKNDQEYASDVLGQRLEVAENLIDDFEKNRPQGTLGEAQKGLHDARVAAVAEERALWDRLPEMHSPLLPTNGIKAAVAKLRKGPKASRRYIPDEAKVIDEFGVQESIQEIQGLRSELLDTLREAQAFGAPSDLRRKARRIMPILEEIQKVLDDIPNMPNPMGGDNAAFSAAYEAARGATKRNAQLFSPEREAIEAMSTLTHQQRIVNKLKSAADPVEEVRNLRQIYGAGSPADESLKAMVWDDIFGETLGDKSARTMESAVSDLRNGAFYREVFGEEGMSFINEIIRRQRVAMTGKAGTTAQAMSVGSGQSIIDQLATHAGAQKGPIWSVMTYSGRYIKDKALNREEVVSLLIKASQDIRLAKALLEDPTPAGRAAWRLVMDQGIAQVRQEAKRQTARTAQRRVFTGKEKKK